MATISTHNGSTLSQAHNRREKKVVDKEEHIKKDGHHEEWLDRDIREEYARLFGQAQEEYNEKQKRKDRQISDYFEQIQQDKKKHIAYEMIVGVYDESIDEKTKKQILWDFAKGWKERNPNLAMVGCYYHDDEEGQPHIHIDYIPIAQCDRGMRVQNSLDRALGQQGVECGTSIHETRQIRWEQRENKVLEELCQARGIEVQHSEFYKGHESTSAYKQRQIAKENRELQQENKRQQEINEKNQKALQKQVAQYNKQKEEIEYMKRQLAYAQAKLNELKDEYVDESFGNMKQFATKETLEEKKRELDL